MQNYSLMRKTHIVGTGNSTTLAAFKLATGVVKRRGAEGRRVGHSK